MFGLLLLLFPLLLMVVEDGGSLALLAMLLVGGYALLRYRFRQALQRDEWALLGTLAFFVLVHLVDVLVRSGDFAEFDNASRFLLLLPIFFFLRKFDVAPVFLSAGLVLGAVGCGGLAVYQVIIGDAERATGITNAVPFGGISMTLGMMCLVFVWPARDTKTRAIFAVGFMAAGVAAMLSLTRGAWLALPAGVLVLVVINPGQLLRPAMRYGVLLCMLAGVLALSQLPATKQRLAQVWTESQGYLESGPSLSSVGLRLEVWRASLLSIGDHPLTGIGLGNFRAELKRLGEAGQIDPLLYGRLAHAHNEFLAATMDLGPIGLIALCLVYAVPLLAFLARARTAGRETLALLMSGVMLVVCSLTQSLTDIHFGLHNKTIFYLCLIYAIYGMSVVRSDSRAGS